MPATPQFSIGLDFGTNSVRALVVDVADGREIASAVAVYEHGEQGVILEPKEPDLARQHPTDYLVGIEKTVREALKQASAVPGFDVSRVVGFGVDTTGSTPMPITESGDTLANDPRFAGNKAAMAWLWKDHTGHAEAAEITALAKKVRPQYLARCGGTYSSEWFWSKALHCARTAPDVFDAMATWVECADWIPAVLTGTQTPEQIKRGICAAGHKAMFHESWGGYPDAEFLGQLDPRLAKLRATLPDKAYSVAETAGTLTQQWADRLALPAGIPVSVGAFDAHLGAVGSGIAPGTLVKIVGTSTCDIMTSPLANELPEIPGLCGIVPESVLPEFHGLEAGQSAVGDIFNWFVNVVRPEGATHESLTKEAEELKPGESGLLALDWHNGNRTVLVDQRLTGLIVGLTLSTRPAAIYRALIEGTAFGSRAIIERLEQYGVKVERVVVCGGISTKNRLLLQIYADVLNRPIAVAASTQTCALGAAICGAVVGGAYPSYGAAVEKMAHVSPDTFKPIAKNVDIYDRLYSHYRHLHDLFGTQEHGGRTFDVMKDLLKLRDEAGAA